MGGVERVGRRVKYGGVGRVRVKFKSGQKSVYIG